jgi:hypothetical protein
LEPSMSKTVASATLGRRLTPKALLFMPIRVFLLMRVIVWVIVATPSFSDPLLQLSYSVASGHMPLIQPAPLLPGPLAVGRSRFGVDQPSGSRGAAHRRWSVTH